MSAKDSDKPDISFSSESEEEGADQVPHRQNEQSGWEQRVVTKAVLPIICRHIDRAQKDWDFVINKVDWGLSLDIDRELYGRCEVSCQKYETTESCPANLFKV